MKEETNRIIDGPRLTGWELVKLYLNYFLEVKYLWKKVVMVRCKERELKWSSGWSQVEPQICFTSKEIWQSSKSINYTTFSFPTPNKYVLHVGLKLCLLYYIVYINNTTSDTCLLSCSCTKLVVHILFVIHNWVSTLKARPGKLSTCLPCSRSSSSNRQFFNPSQVKAMMVKMYIRRYLAWRLPLLGYGKEQCNISYLWFITLINQWIQKKPNIIMLVENGLP